MAYGMLKPALLTKMSILPIRQGDVGQTVDILAAGHVGNDVFQAGGRLDADLGGGM
jgi:hypothetical protein